VLGHQAIVHRTDEQIAYEFSNLRLWQGPSPSFRTPILERPLNGGNETTGWKPMLLYPSRRHFGCTAIAQGRLPEIARQSEKPKEHRLPACVLICGGLRCRAEPRGKPRFGRSLTLPKASPSYLSRAPSRPRYRVFRQLVIAQRPPAQIHSRSLTMTGGCDQVQAAIRRFLARWDRSEQ
jgi:hypothetical protein